LPDFIGNPDGIGEFIGITFSEITSLYKDVISLNRIKGDYVNWIKNMLHKYKFSPEEIVLILYLTIIVVVLLYLLLKIL